MIFTVAIDGPAAAGKGTIAKAVAKHFGFAHLDSGLLYRATGRRVLNGQDPVDAAASLTPQDLAHDDLRNAQVAQAASKVAPNPQVRSALVDFQRSFARRPGGAVIDGRDIGTVICPQAEVKLYVTASDAVRAQRRFQELAAKGADTDVQTVLRDLQERDARDREREVAPMRPADDAVMLDTSDMSIAQAVSRAISLIAAQLPSEIQND